MNGRLFDDKLANSSLKDSLASGGSLGEALRHKIGTERKRSKVTLMRMYVEDMLSEIEALMVRGVAGS